MPLQMCFWQGLFMYQRSVCCAAISPGSFPCWCRPSCWRAAGVSHVSRWGTVRARRVDSHSASHFAHSGVLAVSLLQPVRGAEFSFLVLPVLVLGSSICAGSKETWKRSHWGCLAERKRINLLKEKDLIFLYCTFQLQPYINFILISCKPHMYWGCLPDYLRC